MEQTYSVRCSNCGSLAIRSHYNSKGTKYTNSQQNRVIQTECPTCDYLMVMCSSSGNVIEAHSSSTSAMTRKDKKHNSHPAIPIVNISTISWSTKLSA